jgi:hypothetical protein
VPRAPRKHAAVLRQRQRVLLAGCDGRDARACARASARAHQGAADKRLDTDCSSAIALPHRKEARHNHSPAAAPARAFTRRNSAFLMHGSGPRPSCPSPLEPAAHTSPEAAAAAAHATAAPAASAGARRQGAPGPRGRHTRARAGRRHTHTRAHAHAHTHTHTDTHRHATHSSARVCATRPPPLL